LRDLNGYVRDRLRGAKYIFYIFPKGSFFEKRRKMTKPMQGKGALALN
jgi:hypothetical protein